MFSYNWLSEQAGKIGLILSDNQVDQFKLFEQTLAIEKEKFNLTAADWGRLIPDHFLDSLTVSLCEPFTGSCRLVDIGSGAGFPGIPLKIAFPDITLLLIESQIRRARFLEHLISELGLSKTKVLQLRAEEAGRNPDLREKNDIVVARAVADLRVLLEYALPLLTIGGSFIALKGPKGPAEAELAKAAAVQLGGEIDAVIPVNIIPGKVRYLILFKKTAVAPRRFPRRAGIPSKRPLK